jgi:transmembrane sensor
VGSTPLPPLPVAPEIAEQAVRWLVDLQEGPESATLREAWERWRRANPEHERAWQHIEAANERLRLAPGALTRRVVAGPARAGRRRAIKLLVLVAAGGSAGWVATDPRMLSTWAADHRTRIGERRAIRLEDGTRVVLNTDSALNVRFGDTDRLVRLVRGEILVTTAADSHALPRPFLVETAHGRLHALGTRFSVRMHEGETRVAVFEGAVALKPAERPDATVTIPAGREGLLSRLGSRDVGPVAEGADAWESGMIVASGMALSAFLEELSRHRPGRLACAPEIAGLPVSGTYPLDDGDKVLAALERALPVRVQRFTRYWVSVVPRPA